MTNPELAPIGRELDRAGNPTCGQDFMAGTICSLPPGHEGGCAPICQVCGGDWYAQTCTCQAYCAECGAMFDHDGERRFCEDCGSHEETDPPTH